jgi:pyruvate,water dikinase
VAGVLMTSNPLRPHAGELVIDAAYGLGESVVSGKVQPDHLVVRKSDGEIVDARLGSKETALVYRKGRTLEVHIAEERRAQCALSDEQIEALRSLAVQVEAKIGPRQDCEWAFAGDQLYVLQQRPITGMAPENPEQVFSRKFGDEYIADYTLPLSYSVLMPWISETFLADFSKRFGFADRLQHPPTIRHEGYAYVSGEFVAQMMSAVPKALRRVDSVDWFPEAWTERVKSEPFRPWQLGRMAWTALRDPNSSLRRNPDDLAAHCQRIVQRIVPKLRQDYAALSEDEWENQFAEALRLGEEHFFVIRWGMGFYNPLLHGFLKDFLARWAGDDGSLYHTLISGLPETKTAEVNRALWRLAQSARQDAVVTALLEENIAYVLAREASPESPFWTQFDHFMQSYGHRGATRDIALPRWSETPDVVLGLLRAQLAANAADPDEVERQAMERRRAAEESLESRLGRGLTVRAKLPLLREILSLAQTYTVYRENQRFYLDYILAHLRRLVLEAGNRLERRDIVERAGDVFFLEKTEFLDARRFRQPTPVLRTKVIERQAHFEKWRDRLPSTYLYDGIAVDELPKQRNEKLPEGALEGLAASLGKVRARARVIRSMEQLGTVQQGEILVANNTDPGWTSVFPLLAGLVTGTGGILSHGALLAREYGIPAVTGVQGAVDKIRTGDLLELNAVEGWVRVEEGEAGVSIGARINIP